MSSELRVFENSEFGELAVKIVDGTPYFPATGCANLLGYKSPYAATWKICKDVRKLGVPTKGGVQLKNYISDRDFFHLVLNTRLSPAAGRFTKWVYNEVLPAICKAGSSSLPPKRAPTATAHAPEDYRLTPLRIKEGYKRVQLLVQLQPSLYETIKAKADAEGSSVNDFIHRVLEDAVKREAN